MYRLPKSLRSAENSEKRKYGTREEYLKGIYLENLRKYENKIKLLIDSDINFNSFGWKAKACRLINCRKTKITKWMIKYMPETYKIAYKT